MKGEVISLTACGEVTPLVVQEARCGSAWPGLGFEYAAAGTFGFRSGVLPRGEVERLRDYLNRWLTMTAPANPNL